MTVEELIEIYEAAVTKRYTEWVNAPEDDNISNDMLKRAGVTAIVRALRDEFVTVFRREYLDDASIETFLSAQVVGMLDQILGSDAGENVAEMPDLPTRTVQLTGITKSQRPDIQFEPATDPIRDAVAMARGRALVVDDIPMLNKLAAMMSPATDAAPAVCVWEKSPLRLYEHSPAILYRTGCGADFFYNYKQCQGCGKPIKFTEAK